MKAYYYLLYRIYKPLVLGYGNDYKTINYLLTTTSTLIVYMFYYTFLSYFDYYFFEIEKYIIPNATFVIIHMLIIGLLNYFIFVKKKKFLSFNFKTDKIGGYLIILFIVLNGFLFIFVANKNRDKIIKEKEVLRIETIK